MVEASRRVFLGWEPALLDRAADWLVEEFGEDLSGVMIALPGGRAGRKLQEKLAHRQPASWLPPRILTQGALTDALVRVNSGVAHRIVRTLIWEKALRATSQGELARLLRRAPESDDAGAWSRLAETLRTLHGELAPEGRDFAAVAGHLQQLGKVGESRRWETLANVQAAYRSELAALSLVDPHESRLESIERGEVHSEGRIVLVGVADMNHLLRRALESVAESVTALVFAPGSEEATFDTWGCLRVESWKDRNVPLDVENWLVADKPMDQARLATEWLAAQGEHDADQVTIGLADEEVAPFLERHLAEQDIRARHAAGVSIDRTLPYRLLEAVGEFLGSNSWRDFAALVRHPDLEAHFKGLDPAATCDAYHSKFIPDRVDLGDSLDGEMETLRTLLVERLGKLANSRPAPLINWAAKLREFLLGVYEEQEFDLQSEPERVSSACLQAVAAMLAELENLPGDLGKKSCTASEAISFLLRELSSGFIPPAPPVANELVVELLGWLELTLDDSPYLVVTGFCDGHVPEAIGSDPFLPNRLRTELQLVDGDARQARDVHELTVLCHSRKAAFITGRRAASGDPLNPSRLAFHCDPAETASRVQKFLSVSDARAVEDESSGKERSWSCPVRESVPALESLSVTAFKRYLESPYQFYLSQVLRFETLDDDARELDGGQFGSLAHDVLEYFGRSAVKDEGDADKIDKFLQGALKKLAIENYGEAPLPAVALQIQQLSYRLHIFASKQAQRFAEGWRIEHVEWSPDQPCQLEVDGEPIRIKGRIDRIDRHAQTGEWAILDYKTSDKALKPGPAHYASKTQRWKDLQLPLYCLLTQSLMPDLGELPQLGYANLGVDEPSVGFEFVPRSGKEAWDEQLISEAHELACNIVRKIRAGEFSDPGKARVYDFMTQTLVGVGLMESGEDEEDDA